MAGATTMFATGQQNIDALLQPFKWDGVNRTYNFPTLASFYPGDYFTGVPVQFQFDISATFAAATTSLQSTITWTLLNQFAAVTPTVFTLAASTAPSDHSFAMADLPNFGGIGFGPGSIARGGDGWFDSLQPRFANIQAGDSAWRLVLHEVGHTMGLKHGHETGGVAALPMAADRDSMEFAVMTYRKYEGALPNNDNGADVGAFGFAQTLMMYDIAALQAMYGANFTTNAGNTTYRWDPATGQMFIDGVGQWTPGGNKIFMTLWDGNGLDTYDFSNYTTRIDIDLAPGRWSVLSQAQLAQLSVANSIFARGNVFNALQFQGDSRSLIENAIGGFAGDLMFGNTGANRLDGRLGADTMYGGLGDDVYVMDNVGDIASEIANAGFDTVITSVNYIARLNIEAVTLTGTSATTIAGNTLANELTGNALANVINGLDGDDTLDGGLGSDAMRGGKGDDTYRVDSPGDIASETANEGIDTVVASVNFTVRTSVEKLVLTGAASIGAGNELDNTLTGNALANRFLGLAGNDTIDGGVGIDDMRGGVGDDTYIVDNTGDVIVETVNQGIDSVFSSVNHVLRGNVENLTLTGAAVNGIGNALDNAILGTAGNNSLAGKDGFDQITTGTGSDFVYFDTTPDGGTNADFISDFDPAFDLIRLSPTVFNAIPTGVLASTRFHIGSQAADSIDRIIYDPFSGMLIYDADGSGAGLSVHFATLNNRPPSLSASDFVVA